MQFQQAKFDMDARPSSNIRYSNQQFFSIAEGYDVYEEKEAEQKIEKEQQLQLIRPEDKRMISAFEKQYIQHKKQQEERFYSLPAEERMYFMMDKDSGQIFDMRNPAQKQEIERLFNNPIQNKEKAWNEYIKLSQKMNEHLIDFTEMGDELAISNLLESRTEFYLDIDTRGLDNWTPLHIAANEGYNDIIKLLLKEGANIEALTKFNRTPLLLAVLQNQYDSAQLLIQKGAQVNAQDLELNTSLHLASQLGNEKLIELLLNNKADSNIRNQLNQNALQVCADVKCLEIFNKFGIEYKQSNYDRTILPGTNFLLKNSRFDHVAKLIDKTQGKGKKVELIQEAQRLSDKQQPLAKPSKFINLAKFIRVEMSQDAIKLSPNQFNFYQLLGKGAFGEVYLVDKIGQNPQKYYAMKILKKDKMLSQNLLKYVQTEKDVLSIMHHPFIVKLNYAFQTESKLFLVMDFCPGGDLSKLLDIKRKLPEEIAKIYVAEILLAIECLHRNNIIFRDLKPENVVIDAEGHAMLTDFGLSKKGVGNNQLCESFCGSPAYLPPEILSRSGHNRMADWYLLGVMTYELLVGIPPYYDNNREILFENIKKGPLKIPRTLNPDAKDFIVALLNRDPTLRLGFERDGEDVREHIWLQEIDWDQCYNRQLKPPKPIEQQINKIPLKINFMETSEQTNKVNRWTFYEES